ncbi:hypothetical protein UFOVP509_24 [uncultured Caudovirales phage]|uniref:Uncharacterized protein n=1 Tax=uncultured Caudovirales phage TaxID=2100421 RepID=A0A6J5MQM1_9CAUD|nr:hypothetical protein UFOVP509_24 [uncultured Caudovirales phage]
MAEVDIPALIAERDLLAANLRAWQDRFHAILGEMSPDSAGNMVISLLGQRDRLAQANAEQAQEIATLKAEIDDMQAFQVHVGELRAEVATLTDRIEWINSKRGLPDWCCEAHPDLPWPHIDAQGRDCLGPGMPAQNRQELVSRLQQQVATLTAKVSEMRRVCELIAMLAEELKRMK